MKNPILFSIVLLSLVISPYHATITYALTEPIQVTTTGASQPTVSPDGNWLAYTVPGEGIAKIPTNGGEPDTLTLFGREPDWSRTSDLIIFRSGLSLYTVDASTGDTAHIRTGGFDDDPAWSPNGDEIAVQGSILIVSYPDGSISTLPCTTASGSQCHGESPTWSPGGDSIAFEHGTSILRVPRSGGKAITVVKDLRDVAYPAWSPNGEWIAFMMESETYIDAHIWVADAQGIDYGLWQVTSGSAFDYRPSWSPDSDIIYFQSNRSGQSEIWKVAFSPTNIIEEVCSLGGEVPEMYGLNQNYPNPFNPETWISYQLPSFSPVTIKIYNVNGQLVNTLVDEDQDVGTYRVHWNGRDLHGTPVASGVYFCRLRAGNFDKAIKMVLMK